MEICLWGRDILGVYMFEVVFVEEVYRLDVCLDKEELMGILGRVNFLRYLQLLLLRICVIYLKNKEIYGGKQLSSLEGKQRKQDLKSRLEKDKYVQKVIKKMGILKK